MGAMVRSELGKVGWAWNKIRRGKKKKSGKLKFEIFWFLESEKNQLVQNAFSLQECAECLNSLSCPQRPQSPEHSDCQRGKWEKTVLGSSTSRSFAPLWPPQRSPVQHSRPVCCHRNEKPRQKARYGNIGAFHMQGLLHGGQQGEGIACLHSPINPRPGHCSANCLAPG